MAATHAGKKDKEEGAEAGPAQAEGPAEAEGDEDDASELQGKLNEAVATGEKLNEQVRCSAGWLGTGWRGGLSCSPCELARLTHHLYARRLSS
jgi:hypothetical protein